MTNFKADIRFVAILIAFAAFSCAPSKEAATVPGAAPAAITNQFKMLTINLQHGLKDKTDVRKFADWVKSTGAELVAVQQIVRATDSKPDFDAYMELLKRLDMRGTFAKARYFQGWDSGNALFCLYPLLQSNAYMLPTGKGKTRRSLAFGVFEMGLKPMAFASTDLDGDDLSERVKQVYEILSIQRSVQEYPMVLAGEFGESSKGKAAAKLSDKFHCANSMMADAAGVEQQVHLPADGKMRTVAAEKITYKSLNTTGLLVTVEVTQ